MAHVVIVGGGPGGYEAALVAASVGAEVTVIERQGLGGNAVLTDVVPSKTVIATAEWLTIADRAPQLGIRDSQGPDAGAHTVDLAAVNARVAQLARKQSDDIATRLERSNVEVITGQARLEGGGVVRVGQRQLQPDYTILAVGARPRVLDGCVSDGQRILTWTQLYGLTELPEHLVVVGSGVTGAEFAGAYLTLGSRVTLISSGERVLAREDPEAAQYVQQEFARRGMTVLGGQRARRVVNTGSGVQVELADGAVVEGSHCLMAVGSVPNTEGLGLDAAGVRLTGAGYIEVDRVSRTSAQGIYAAGDCTGVLPLASVAATQGRIAVAHALGDAVAPLELGTVATNVFTLPEIASVGASEADLRARGIFYEVARIDLARNPRAKMLGIDAGFVKVFGHTVTGQVLGAVVVGPRAGEHIFPLTLAVTHHLTVDDVASAFTVYPSLAGSIAEAARTLHTMREPAKKTANPQ